MRNTTRLFAPCVGVNDRPLFKNNLSLKRWVAAIALGFSVASASAATVLYEATLGTTVSASYYPPFEMFPGLPPSGATNSNEVQVTGGNLLLSPSTDQIAVHFSLPEGYRMEAFSTASQSIFQLGAFFSTNGIKPLDFTSNTVSISYDNLVGTAPTFFFDSVSQGSILILRVSSYSVINNFSFTGITLTFGVQNVPSDLTLSSAGTAFIFQDQNYYGAPPPNASELLRITNIPEPSGAMLLGVGAMAALAFTARRRMTRAA